MSPGTDQVVLSLESGIRAAQQGLFQFHRAAVRDVGLSLHLAAFAAVCFGVQVASETEVDVADLHARIERALRHLCAAWDERPAARRRRSVADVLRRFGDDDGRPGLQDSRAVYLAVPDAPAPEPGERGDYAVDLYRRYVDGVYLYSCDPKRPNTWDEGGGEFALERALFRDIYGTASPPTFDAGRSVFGVVVRSYRGVGGDGAA